jgi:hypothetical protein
MKRDQFIVVRVDPLRLERDAVRRGGRVRHQREFVGER